MQSVRVDMKTKHYPNPIIAERVNIMKRNLLISDEELAQGLTDDRKTVISWRQCGARIPADAILAWSIRYHVPVEWLLGISDIGEPKPIDVYNTPKGAGSRMIRSSEGGKHEVQSV